jgi:hypothetical protein
LNPREANYVTMGLARYCIDSLGCKDNTSTVVELFGQNYTICLSRGKLIYGNRYDHPDRNPENILRLHRAVRELPHAVGLVSTRYITIITISYLDVTKKYFGNITKREARELPTDLVAVMHQRLLKSFRKGRLADAGFDLAAMGITVDIRGYHRAGETYLSAGAAIGAGVRAECIATFMRDPVLVMENLITNLRS